MLVSFEMITHRESSFRLLAVLAVVSLVNVGMSSLGKTIERMQSNRSDMPTHQPTCQPSIIERKDDNPTDVKNPPEPPIIVIGERSRLRGVNDLPENETDSDVEGLKPTLMPYTPVAGIIPNGVLSDKPPSFFSQIRFRIDNIQPYDRCRSYKFIKEGTDPNGVQMAKRRIFFGSLIADEPWETLEIIAAETFGIFAGMVFVESIEPSTFLRSPYKGRGMRRNSSCFLVQRRFRFAPISMRIHRYRTLQESMSSDKKY